MLKIKTSLFAIVCFVSVIFSAVQVQAAEFINILTGGTSGVYYPLGNALAQVYGKAIADSKVTVQATKASAENLNLIQAQKGEIAFTLGDTLSSAYVGKEEAGFKQALTKLRGIANIYPNYIQLVATADSGIKSLADLKGKRVSVGAPKSGTELNARAVFKAAGLSYSDFAKTEYLGFGESVDLMKNRQLDATLQSAGLGVASIKDLATSQKIVIIPVPVSVVRAIGDEAYQNGTIPAGTYEGQSADVETAKINNVLVTHDAVSEDMAYRMTKALFDGLADLKAAHSAANAINVKDAASTPIPLHLGAMKYYKEVGVLK